MSFSNFHLSEQERDHLIKLKRHTSLQNWNSLSRWAFCASLAEPSPPPPAKILSNSNVDMDWPLFGGDYAEIYMALLRHRCRRDGLELSEETLYQQFRLHLNRGIGYLAANRGIRSIADLFKYCDSAEALNLPPK